MGMRDDIRVIKERDYTISKQIDELSNQVCGRILTTYWSTI